MHAVVHADGALARVMRKAALLGPLVQRKNCVGRQRTKAHGGNVEHAGLIGLRTRWPNSDAKVMRANLRGRNGMVDPLVALSGYVQLRAKGPLVGFALGPLVHQRALRA